MKQKTSIVFTLVFAILMTGNTFAGSGRNYISIVGSSTVYPFSTVVVERFEKGTKFKTPKVEATGSGGGLKLFCSGIGTQYSDITNASRRIKQSEIEKCKKNGVSEIIEVKIGYDGIALANSKKSKLFSLSLQDIFLALAKEVPDPKGGETLVKNPYKTWKDVNVKLPNQPIEVLGPPPTSGTRDAFVELAMEGGCETIKWIKALNKEGETALQKNLSHDTRGWGLHRSRRE